jgi:hypothetical protein
MRGPDSSRPTALPTSRPPHTVVTALERSVDGTYATQHSTTQHSTSNQPSKLGSIKRILHSWPTSLQPLEPPVLFLPQHVAESCHKKPCHNCMLCHPVLHRPVRAVASCAAACASPARPGHLLPHWAQNPHPTRPAHGSSSGTATTSVLVYVQHLLLKPHSPSHDSSNAMSTVAGWLRPHDLLLLLATCC